VLLAAGVEQPVENVDRQRRRQLDEVEAELHVAGGGKARARDKAVPSIGDARSDGCTAIANGG
jgi:hypothetical protein